MEVYNTKVPNQGKGYMVGYMGVYLYSQNGRIPGYNSVWFHNIFGTLIDVF